MKDIRKILGKNVRRLISQGKTSSERFAYENGISKARMYDIANGTANISIDMLQRLAEGFKVKPQDLIS